MTSSVRFSMLLSCVLLVACGSEEISSPMPASEPVTGAATEETAITTPIPELGNFGIDLSSQDSSAQPGDDFFRFANGMWLDNFNLPADRSSYGSFTVLSDRSDQYVRVIIDDLTSAEPAVGSIEQKISDYYLSYMETEALNQLGVQPLIPGLAKLSEIDTQEELITSQQLLFIPVTIIFAYDPNHKIFLDKSKQNPSL